MKYEEVVKDVKELSNLAEWYESDVISNGYEEAKKHREDMTQRVIKFIEKEHKLLGLYQRKDIYGKTILPYKEYLKICDEIIIKEKELEEMK